MFELAMPWAFLLLPLPWIFRLLVPRARVSFSTAVKVPFYHAISQVTSQPAYALKEASLYLLMGVWILLTIALAGPRWVGDPISTAREGHNIMLVLDVSGSMELGDMLLHGRPATRLAVVKRAAIEFLNKRAGDRIGLILFGTKAYLQTPLTYDRQSVLMRIDDATVGLAGNSTSLGDALGLAVKRLEDVPAKGRVIILLTDGANNSGVLPPLKTAELARQDDIKVYTIGLGSEMEANSFGGVFLSMNAGADLDEETLKEVAKITGGRYFRATDMASLQSIYETINRLEIVPHEDAIVRPQHDYYPWFLAGAFLLFMYWLGSQPGLWRSFGRTLSTEEVDK